MKHNRVHVAFLSLKPHAPRHGAPRPYTAIVWPDKLVAAASDQVFVQDDTIIADGNLNSQHITRCTQTALNCQAPQLARHDLATRVHNTDEI